MSVQSWLDQWNWGAWLKALLAPAISAGLTPFAANPIATLIGAVQFTPRQLAMGAVAMFITTLTGVWQKRPFPDRRVAIAVLRGVHTVDEVDKIDKATAPGTVVTPEIAAAILGKPAPPLPDVPQQPPDVPKPS